MSDAVDDTDWKAVAISLGAIDARACTIIEAADRLAEAVERHRMFANALSWRGVINALEAFKIVRQGQ